MDNFASILFSGLFLMTMLLSGPSCTSGSADRRESKDGQAIFTVGELQADFRQFRKFLEQSHPQLYRFTSRQQFDSLFGAHYRMIYSSMTAQEFYRILIPLVAKVGCGHTSLWTPDGYWDRAPERMFPLGVHAREGQLFVVHSYHQPSPVKYGSRILAVNGQDARDLVGEMLENIWSDGFIATRRYRRLNRVFPYLYALHCGFPGKFEILVREDGREQRVRMEPVPRRVITAYRDYLVASGAIRKEDLHLELLDHRTALLTLRTFAFYEDNKGFNRFIDSSFQVIREAGIKHLILDLRGNDGGDPFCSTYLLSYLQQKPVIYFSRPYGRYARLNQPLPMADHPFTGDQYYLIDGMCCSTTGHLTALLKYYELGTFIGEETGATYTCNDASHDTYLKNTGYRLQSARFSFSAAVTGFPLNRGILPDHPVQETVDDVISGKDAVLGRALELITQKHADDE